MKKFFITIVFAGLFVMASSVFAQSDAQKAQTKATTETKAPAKVCSADKKACCTAKAGETKACCADKKDGTKAACCADKKDGTKAACCVDKKDGAKAACCTNKSATTDAKSSGKKAN